MCLACEMEAMWFAAMEAGTGAAAAEALPLASDSAAQTATLLPPPENERVGEGIARGTRGEAVDPRRNPPPEEGGGGASGQARRGFSCEETPSE
jgi:hypothetical protein